MTDQELVASYSAASKLPPEVIERLGEPDGRNCLGSLC